MPADCTSLTEPNLSTTFSFDEAQGFRLTNVEKELLDEARSKSSSPEDSSNASSDYKLEPMSKGDLDSFINVNAIKQQLLIQKQHQDTLLQRNFLQERQRKEAKRRVLIEKIFSDRRSRTSLGFEEVEMPEESEAALPRFAQGNRGSYRASICPKIFLGDIPPEIRNAFRQRLRATKIIQQM